MSRVGKAEAEALAVRLRDQGIREIRSSAITRALETAIILSQVLRVPLREDERLNEIRMGPWEGLTEEEVARAFPKEYRLWQERPDLLRLPGRETLEMIASRVNPAVCEAASTAGKKVLVTHVAPIRVVTLSVLGLSLRYYKKVPVRNAECLLIDWGAREVRRMGHVQSLRLEIAPL